MNIEWRNVQSKPHVGVAESKGLYTVAVWDPDAPKPAYLHLLYQNVAKDQHGDVVVGYQKPSPPQGQSHRYVVQVLQQPGPVPVPATPSARQGFRPESLVGRLVAQRECRSDGKTLRC